MTRTDSRRVAAALLDEAIEENLTAYVNVMRELRERPADKKLHALAQRQLIELDRFLRVREGLRPRR